ncbi:hypothetical protein B5S28_g3201 [[Candida] boidinii]|uniref:Unnamed protein product n=1 Tax=Candida boidinii TaxID=5477 RepID=A0ACB5TFT3_CANBO|nr:hypothetical protein B5S28_g3201 [[Candida] boidinii]OWB61484.1 hypothetical protein B5S29_g2375 [[Candida] boidinii]OWB70717.1 hypothetical protein B5S31_g396 [[Candida] boidinii]OWB76173.1 hypothetical protein B5S32_g323 [[Candida] boidinii]GME74729.1 unnamed protein product [[Candida] boidinii]
MSDILPTFSKEGEVTIITGGSGGLGSIIAKGLIANGSEIALLDMNLERTQESANELKKFCEEELKLKDIPKISAWACNIADAENVDTVFASVAEEHGKLVTNLVNCAGYCENFAAEEYPAKNAEQLTKVNLLGSLYVSQSFARPLIKAGKAGAVVLIGSMSGTIVNTPQNQVAYNMTKAGVIHMARSLACEWATYNIRVNTLSPGYILTPLTKNVINGNAEMREAWVSRVPMKRLSEPKEFIGSVLYLLSNSASSYTTGHNLVVDGGYECW